MRKCATKKICHLSKRNFWTNTHVWPAISHKYVLSHSKACTFRAQQLITTCAQLSSKFAELAANPSADILDAMRGLERKTATVFTLLKASVYSIVLQQEIFGEEQEALQNEAQQA